MANYFERHPNQAPSTFVNRISVVGSTHESKLTRPGPCQQALSFGETAVSKTGVGCIVESAVSIWGKPKANAGVTWGVHYAYPRIPSWSLAAWHAEERFASLPRESAGAQRQGVSSAFPRDASKRCFSCVQRQLVESGEPHHFGDGSMRDSVGLDASSPPATVSCRRGALC